MDEEKPAEVYPVASIFQPVGWKLSCLDGRRSMVSKIKNEPWEEHFGVDDRRQAEVRKAALQTSGIVVCLTPVYLGTREKNKVRKHNQMAPFGHSGQFNKGWRIP